MAIYLGYDGIFTSEPIPSVSATPGTITTSHVTYYGPDSGVIDWLGGSYGGSVISGAPTSYFVYTPLPGYPTPSTVAVFGPDNGVIDWNRGSYVGSIISTPSRDGASTSTYSVYNYTGKGGAVFGGAADSIQLVNFESDGGAVLGGNAEQVQVRVFTGAGGGVAGGTCTFETYGPLYFTHVGAGGGVVGGAATYVVMTSHRATGGGVVGGSSIVTYRIISTAGNPMMLMGL